MSSPAIIKANPRAEFLIPTIVDDMIKEGSAKVKVLVSDDKWYGVTYQEDKPKVQKAFAMLVVGKHLPFPPLLTTTARITTAV